MSIFDNESDFDDAYDMEDAMNMFSKLASVSNDLTKLCVKAEIASGNKLSTADVQNIFKQNFQITGRVLSQIVGRLTFYEKTTFFRRTYAASA